VFVAAATGSASRGSEAKEPPRSVSPAAIATSRAASHAFASQQEDDGLPASKRSHRRPHRRRDKAPGVGHGVLFGVAGFLFVVLVGGGIVLAVVPSRGKKADPRVVKDAAPAVPAVVGADRDGSLTLVASAAKIHGDRVRYESGRGHENIGFWSDPTNYVSWDILVRDSGRYRVELTYSCENIDGGSTYMIGVGPSQVTGRIEGTGTWMDYRTENVGVLNLAAGAQTLGVWATTMPRGAVMNLRQIRLIPIR
jgi:hypothetical protein